VAYGTLAVALLVPPAHAEAGVDLLLLVDRSASTRGASALFDTVMNVTAELLARSAASSHLSHRLAIVSFGSAVRIDLPFTPVDDRERVRRVIASIPAANLGRTDVAAAFRTSRDLFASLSRDPLRRRAIVLITDGVPYVVPNGAHCDACDVRHVVESSFAATTIDILLLSDNRQPGIPAGLWQTVAPNRVHEMHRDRVTAVRTVHAVLATILGQPSAESHTTTTDDETAEVLVVPPYLDVIVFDIVSQNAPVEQVAIYAPDALRPLDRDRAGIDEVRLGDTLSSVTIRRPAPGAWMFRVPERRVHVNVFSQQFFPRGTLVKPLAADPPRQHDDVEIAYRIMDSEGAPLRELAEYPLSLSLSLVAPDGKSVATAMKRRSDLGPATFAATMPATCRLAGRHWTDVQIATRDLGRNEVVIFHDQWSGFMVTPAQRIDCHARPFRTQVAALGIRTPPVTISLECPDELLRAVDRSLQTWIRSDLYRDEQLLRDGVMFHRRGTTLEGRIDTATKPGAYRLHLAVDRARVPAAFNVRIVPPDVVFERKAYATWLIAIAAATAIVMAALIYLLARPRAG
jgi:hypothetical protein